MTQYEQMDLLLEQNKGMIRTAQVLEVGITKTVFYHYAKDRELEQVAHGMRVFKDVGLVEQLGSGMSRILKAYDKSIF